MHNTDKSIAGISKRFHFASLHYIFSAYLPTHIKFLTEFHRIFFGTTCISFQKNKQKRAGGLASAIWGDWMICFYFTSQVSPERIMSWRQVKPFFAFTSATCSATAVS